MGALWSSYVHTTAFDKGLFRQWYYSKNKGHCFGAGVICRAEDIWQNVGEVLLMPSRGTQRSYCSRESRSKGMPGPSVPIKSHDLVGQGICFEAILLLFPLTEVFSSVTSWSTRITENRRGVDRQCDKAQLRPGTGRVAFSVPNTG